MPTKVDVEALFRKNLGKETADVLLSKIDNMVKQKKSPAEIEKAITADIAAEVEKQVASAVIANIGPIQPIKVSTVQSAVKSNIGPKITVSTKVSSGIQVKVGPGMYTKGSK